MKEYYYLDAQKKPCGPHTEDELRALLTLGHLAPETLIAHKGADKWVPLSTLTAPATPEPAAQAPPPVPNPVAGNCPNCGQQITLTNGTFPSRCPHCNFRLCADNPSSLWSNFKLAFSKMFVLRGRAPRIEYWSYYLFAMIFNYAAYFIFGIITFLLSLAIESDMGDPTVAFGMLLILYIIYSLLSLALAIPQITAGVRRLHDIGKSGWLFLVPIPFIMALAAIVIYAAAPTSEKLPDEKTLIISVGILALATFGYGIYLFVLALLDSQRGPNKYGPSSKYPLG